MDLFATINPLLVVSGFVVGMLVGLTGVGGGSLMTPILVLLFGVHATTAVIMGALPRTPVAHHRFDWLSAVMSAATFGMLITGIDNLRRLSVFVVGIQGWVGLSSSDRSLRGHHVILDWKS